MQKLYTVEFAYKSEVIKMKELKGWPFKPLDATPQGGPGDGNPGPI